MRDVTSHPYRVPPPHPLAPARPGGDPEVAVIYALAIVLGAVRLAVALAVGEDLGAEAAIAALLVAGGAVGWLADR